MKREVNVWDTYVTKTDGNLMHFDIIAPVEVMDFTTIYSYGEDYLRTKGQYGQSLDAQQCRLCHIEKILPEWKDLIDRDGYIIIEMEGCE